MSGALLLLLMVMAVGLVLRWPQLTVDRGAFPPISAATVDRPSPPPAWLLPIDDSYIFIRYAQQALRGQPYNWSEGEPSTGISSLSFLALLLPGQALAGDDLAARSLAATVTGLLTLWLAAIAAAASLRVAGICGPWPAVAGLALIVSGPIAFMAAAGMDSALSAAAVLATCATWIAVRRAALPAAVAVAATAFLPFVRPDFAFVVGTAALAVLFAPRHLGLPLSWPRRCLIAILLLAPGFALGLVNRALTGHFSPGGALAKSILNVPFLDLALASELYGTFLTRALLPVYLGRQPHLLPPPVGLLAFVVALLSLAAPWSTRLPSATRHLLIALRPLAVAWLVLFVVAPLSGFLPWQHLRHHHPGLACAWVLATAGVALVVRACANWLAPRLAPRARRHRVFAVAVVLVAGMIAWHNVRSWSFDFFREAVAFYNQSGAIAEELATHRDAGAVLLTHDAGIFALAHDGPMVDAIGLGTTALALPYRHGMGAVVEELARRPRLPDLAAVRLSLFDVPALLGPPRRLGTSPGRHERDRMRLVPVHRQRLARTALERTHAGALVDLAYLASENAVELAWDPPPPADHWSAARALRGASGEIEIHGCRPLTGRLELRLAAADVERSLVVRATRDAKAPTAAGDGLLRIEVLGMAASVASDLPLPPDARRWSETSMRVPTGAVRVRLESAASAPVCVESMAWVGASVAKPEMVIKDSANLGNV